MGGEGILRQRGGRMRWGKTRGMEMRREARKGWEIRARGGCMICRVAETVFSSDVGAVELWAERWKETLSW
jgi:hypothetical protein